MKWTMLRTRVAALAGVAQLVEQLICNQQVTGSSPVASTTDEETIRDVRRAARVDKGSGL